MTKLTSENLETLETLTDALIACNRSENLKDASGVTIASQRGLYGAIYDAIEAIAPGSAENFGETAERPADFVKRRAAIAALDSSIIGYTVDEIMRMDDDDRAEAAAECLNRAADIVRQCAIAFPKHAGSQEVADAADTVIEAAREAY